MSTATLTKKELFVQGSLTTDVAEMIEMLAVNVPGVKSCNVNAVNKSLVLSIDTTKDESLNLPFDRPEIKALPIPCRSMPLWS